MIKSGYNDQSKSNCKKLFLATLNSGTALKILQGSKIPTNNTVTNEVSLYLES